MEFNNLTLEELCSINGGWDVDETTVNQAKIAIAVIVASGQKIYDTAQGFCHGFSDAYNH